MDMINAKTNTQRELAVNQITGKVSGLINELRDDMVQIISNINVNIDYPEYDDVEIMTDEVLIPKITKLKNKIVKILNESRNGRIIKDGIKLDDKIKILSIATRPDCLDCDILELLGELNKQIPIWVELGFQTSNEETAKWMNRGYTNDCLILAVNKLKKLGINVIVHIINGLPTDNYDDMINTVKFLSNLNIDGIKIHMLHVINNSPLGKLYKEEPFPLLTLEEYVKIVVAQLRLLPPNVVIHRITGDADKNELLAPTWTLKKFVVMNEIDKLMRKENYYQGDLYVQDC